jgi:ABC-type multidrug transport system ATPase subunit
VLARSTPDALWEAPGVRVLRPAAVVCRDLRRGRGRHALLAGVNLSVPVGGRLLVVSRPPAAASMLLRILAGLVRPDGGEIELAGLTDASSTGWRQRVAYVEPDPGIPTWLSPREALELAAGFHGLAAAAGERAIAAAAARAGIGGEELERPILRGGHSLLERVALATALVGDPDVLLLDEPLRTLGAASRAARLAFREPRLTMLVASGDPASMATVCSHVALLRDGRLALLTPISRLAERGIPLTLGALEALAKQPRSR